MTVHIETPCLLIRELQQSDAESMFEMDSDAEVHKYVGKKPVKVLDETYAVIEFIRKQYIDNGIGRWAAIEKDTNEFIGWVGFKLMTEKINNHQNYYDFGYRFKKSKWGQGFATEASIASLRYGIETLNFKDIYAMTDVDNQASRNVLEKLGFKFIELFSYDGTLTWREEGELTTWYALR